MDLMWTFDASGNKVPNPSDLKTKSFPLNRKSLSSRIFGKRTLPLNSSSYAKDRFVLPWKPCDYIANKCNRECSDARAEIVKSSCGHTGNCQNNLAASTINVGCGMLST